MRKLTRLEQLEWLKKVLEEELARLEEALEKCEKELEKEKKYVKERCYECQRSDLNEI